MAAWAGVRDGVCMQIVAPDQLRVFYGHSTSGHLTGYASEWKTVVGVLEYPRRGHPSLHVAKTRTHAELQRELVGVTYDVVIVAGDESQLGLLHTVDPVLQARFPIALAELLAASCRPHGTVVLLACNTSHIGPELALRGLHAVAIEGVIDGNGFPAFLDGFVRGTVLGQSSLAAFESGCRAMLFEYWDAARSMRWFGPGPDVEGRAYEWAHEPGEVHG